MISAFKSFWKNAFNFSGRATRSEYWFFMLDNVIIGFILGFLMGITGVLSDSGTPNFLVMAIYYIYLFAIIIPSISLVIRRLHDIGKSGWWYLGLIALNLLCGIGSIVMLVFMCLDSTPDNQWGPNKKMMNAYNQYANPYGQAPYQDPNQYNQNGPY